MALLTRQSQLDPEEPDCHSRSLKRKQNQERGNLIGSRIPKNLASTRMVDVKDVASSEKRFRMSIVLVSYSDKDVN